MKALLAILLLTACAAGTDVGSMGAAGSGGPIVAPADVGLAAEAVMTATGVNCANGGQTVQLKNASIALATACGMAMQNRSGLYACWDTSPTKARCELGFGQGPTPLVALCDINSPGSRPLRNPPGGFVNTQKVCELSGIPGQGSAAWGERLNGSMQSFFPKAIAVAYGASCGQCTDQAAILSYNVNTSNPTIWYNY